MIRLDDVAMRFPRVGQDQFSGVNLHLGPGETAPLLGSNGAGKTTLLRIVAGLITPARGRVTVDGVDVTAHPETAQDRIGISLYPERSFYFRLTCLQNLRYFASLRGLRRREGIEASRAVLDRVGLGDSTDLMFMRLSLGQRRRLGLARALLGSPAVLLLDEPTANLDGAGIEMVHDVLEDHRRDGGTVLLSTHHQQDLRLSTGPVYLLRSGGLSRIEDERRAQGTRRVDVTFGTDRPQYLDLLSEHYAMTRTSDGVVLDIPVDIPLHQIISELGQLGVCVSGVVDELWDTTGRLEEPAEDEPATGRREVAHAVR